MIQSRLREVVAPVVADMGLEFWGLELEPRRGSDLLRVFIENAEGVDVEDCARVSRRLSDVLEVDQPLRGNWRLEVSSPGLARPLYNSGQYRRYLGKNLKLRLKTPLSGRRNFVVTLRDVQGEELLVRADGGELSVALSDVERANLIPDFEEEKS